MISDPGQRLMLAFQGFQELPDEFLRRFREIKPAGVTLFRSLNINHPGQLKHLTGVLQTAAKEIGIPPLLIALDQEGGQLMAVGEATQLPGNMALGAAGSAELAFQAGEVLGSELAAMGINVDYAPCVDVNLNPKNPVVGVRSFGEDPHQVSRLSAALVRGIQSQGVAATLKHFPGHGDTASDSHLGMAQVNHPIKELYRTDLPPFKAGIQAGAQLVMTAHLALPALTGRADLPATLSSQVLQGILREDLGFRGVTISDAMDMRAIRQGEWLAEDAAQAIAAGCDLLLGNSDSTDQLRLLQGVFQAIEKNLVTPVQFEAALGRISALKHWLEVNRRQVGLEVVNGRAHQLVANRIAQASITLVKNDDGLIPLKISDDKKIAVIVPQPQDLTPADTSSYSVPTLGKAIRAFHGNSEEFIFSQGAEGDEIETLLAKLTGADVVIVGTINAFSQPAQEVLVNRILAAGKPTIAVALRLPYDLSAFPQAATYLCTYSILEPSMIALAEVIFGLITPQGHLPVSIPGLASAGIGSGN